jgi:uncharacterized protein YndB with AHSA1/START domain
MTVPTQMTGRRETRDGTDVLVLERTYRAELEDVWAACTDPGRMQRWIGTWSGDPADGAITFRMTAEGDDAPPEIYDVEECEPPRRFALRSREALPFTEDASGPRVHWALRLELAETGGTTTLTFVQSLAEGSLSVDMVSSVGPGWEYYLDRLTAHLRGTDVAAVEWTSYEPGAAYYRTLFSVG